MNQIPGEAKSYWIASTPETSYPSLKGEVEVDVAIVGGGIAGIIAAYLLKKSGKTVALIEAKRLVEEVTGKTTAKLTSLHTLIYKYLIDHFGKSGAKQYADAQEAAIKLVDDLSQKLQIDCDFTRSPAYTYTQTEENLSEIKEEVEAAQSLGLPASFVTQTPLPFEIKGAVKFESQAHFHPRKFLLPLAQLINGDGSLIFENTRITDIKEGEPHTVSYNKGTIKAKDVIVATHFPILNDGFYYARLRPRRSYVYAVKVKGHFPEGMFINTEEPLFSVRPQSVNGEQILIITGEKHRTGEENNTISCYQDLEKIIQDHFEVEEFLYHWSTQDNDTLDCVPYIGKYTPNSKHLFVATGFGGWGMTNGIASGIILSDLILGKKNPWASLFDPNRVKLPESAKNFLESNGIVMKHFLEDKLKELVIINLDEIPRGEGKVGKLNGQNMAVYKDEQGEIHTLSPNCSHMGCVLSFNNAEKSWDCPCHGSRFDTDGKVLHSPATINLEKKVD